MTDRSRSVEPVHKVEASGLAGTLVTLAVALYSVGAGLPYDEGTVQTAATFLVSFRLTAFLPPRQP